MLLDESGVMMSLDCMLNEAFSSIIIAELHKNNPETMNQFFRSLAKFRYSVQGLKDEFITKTTVTEALAKNKSDKILKIWMKGPKVAFFSVANTVIDTEFNWNGKTSRGKRDNTKVFGDPELVAKIMSGEKWSNIGLTDVYQIAISSLKALGEKKQPTEVPTKNDTVIKYTMSSKFKDLTSELSSDFRLQMKELITRNSVLVYSTKISKGNVFGTLFDSDKIEFYLIKSFKQTYYKDRWGVKHKSAIPDMDAVKIDMNGEEIGPAKFFHITNGKTGIIAKSVSDFKKGKYIQTYSDAFSKWVLTSVGAPSNTPSSDSSIKSFDEAKSMVFSDVPVVLGFSDTMSKSGFNFLMNSTFLDMKGSSISYKDLENALSKEFGEDSWIVTQSENDRISDSKVYKCNLRIPFNIKEMEPKLLKVFQSFVKDAEYHTFINETDVERSSRMDAEREAARQKELEKQNAKRAKIEKNKNKVIEWNATTRATRNKVEAQAQLRVDKFMKIAQEAAADCWNNAESYSDVIAIWRKYIPKFNSIPASEPLYDGDIPVNPTGMYYRYENVAGERDYSKPLGIPCVPGYKTSYYRQSKEILQNKFYNWVNSKGSKPGNISPSEYYFLFPSIVVIASRSAILSAGLFPLVNKEFLLSTNNGKSAAGTIRLTFQQFMLADDYFRTNSSCYALK